ncbi:hypothetical protein [Frigoribacterium sp. SL97]|jgi:hypothetical protein|uniref:hypothetical protein n=1 Tax=Frigoribacterium sp. SL97 TaxID=2994664 RepID=UPI00226E8A36|nr:hypothetical protein [Frigoribacterium sp. SL97]WAC50268.1 hypothetical protein OVA02_10235 [Frigoribacterium sp. SL97]
MFLPPKHPRPKPRPAEDNPRSAHRTGIDRVANWAVWSFTAAAALLVVLTGVGGTLATGLLASGISSAAMLAWLLTGVTALYILVTGRPSWFRVRRGRRSALTVAGISAGCFVVASILIAALEQA